MKVILPEKQRRTIELVQDIDPKQWVHVAGTKYFVNKHQKVELEGHDWEDALRITLTTTPFRVPSPRILMPHYMQVCASVRKRNPSILYDGAGEPLSRSARDELYVQRTANIWVWLDAMFEQRKDKLWMLTDHDLVNGELQPTTQQPLESRVIREDGFVELQWNKQGMPVKMSKRQEYMGDKNMDYMAPIHGHVVRFGANSGRLDLLCNRDLQDSDAALGVLFCTKGVAKK